MSEFVRWIVACYKALGHRLVLENSDSNVRRRADGNAGKKHLLMRRGRGAEGAAFGLAPGLCQCAALAQT